jgi:hypothetical protein
MKLSPARQTLLGDSRFVRGGAVRVAHARCAALMVVLMASLTSAQNPAPFSTLDMRVPVPPRPLVAAGQTHLAYEIHITNMSLRPTTLDVVEGGMDYRPTATKRFCDSKRTGSTRLFEGTVRRLRIRTVAC